MLVILLQCHLRPSNDRSILTSPQTHQTLARPSSSILSTPPIPLALWPAHSGPTLPMALLVHIPPPSPRPNSRALSPLQKCRLVALRLQPIRHQQSLPLQRSHGL